MKAGPRIEHDVQGNRACAPVDFGTLTRMLKVLKLIDAAGLVLIARCLKQAGTLFERHRTDVTG